MAVDRQPHPWMVIVLGGGHSGFVAQRSAHAENLFVVRWGAPEAADVEYVKRLIPQLHQKAGRELVYIAIMPADLPIPDETQRKLLMELTEAVLPYCAHLVIVMEARGFRGAILRSAMTAVSLLTKRHETLRVVDSIDTALEIAWAKLPNDRRAVEGTILEVGGQFGQVA